MVRTSIQTTVDSKRVLTMLYNTQLLDFVTLSIIRYSRN
jgi:hypothetical protein